MDCAVLGFLALLQVDRTISCLWREIEEDKHLFSSPLSIEKRLLFFVFCVLSLSMVLWVSRTLQSRLGYMGD